MKKNLAILGLLAAFGGVFVAGCTEKAQEKYGDAGENAAKAADKTVDAAVTDAAETGKAVAEVGDAATTTAAVKNAIVTAKDLDSSNIDVDTADNVVHLKGSVKTEAEKTKAEQLAKGAAPKGATVSNELTIAP